jgi:hypothetical protein
VSSLENSRAAGTAPIGNEATTVVPLPGAECTMNVPFASSTRSRIEARPTRPLCRYSRAFPASKPSPSSMISTRSCPPVVSTATVTETGCACLAEFDRASWTTR